MKVLHCVPSLVGGGAERQVAYLAKGLVQIGWNVHVAYVHTGPNMKRLEETGATLHRLRAFGNYDPQILARVVSTIGKIKPDVVQCWLLQMEVIGGISSLLTRTPWVFSERSCEEAYPPSLKVWLRRKMGRMATAIVSNSEGGERYWRTHARGPLRSRIIRNALPLEEIAQARPATIAETGVAADAPLILSAGRFGPEKNLDTFVRAVRLLVPSHSAHVICCGEGPLRDDIEAFIARCGLTGRVRTFGYAPNLWSLMKRATVTVSVSRFEGTPNVVLEAMACGCPLVVSDIPAHRELLDEQSAIFVDPRDPRHIADGIIAAISDSESSLKRARVACDRVQRYSLSAIAGEYSDLYRELAAVGGRSLTRVAL